mgnify:CR=1 FL=1
MMRSLEWGTIKNEKYKKKTIAKLTEWRTIKNVTQKQQDEKPCSCRESVLIELKRVHTSSDNLVLPRQ